ncbi:hypothetical protein IFM89_015137 [Coptis chinensis]|uniref:Transposase-associated domain-containing protein n=1 Tax=Coptis chinensis TaxID=261450 RepID=A0A835LRW4_9MAGN|nr:hypothetical protein IFM89_015137 [Coptis chinensis]
MSEPINKEWMSEKERGGIVYSMGVEVFLKFAKWKLGGKKCPCPCKKCPNRYWLTYKDVGHHLVSRGREKSYCVWTLHGKDLSNIVVHPPVVANTGETTTGDVAIEMEDTEEETIGEAGIGMGNFVDSSFELHERVVGDGNLGSELDEPYVPEPDLGKRQSGTQGALTGNHLFRACPCSLSNWDSKNIVAGNNLKAKKEVLLFPGKKLDYEPKYCQTQKNEGDFMTAVEFSKSDPYGKAIALFNLKSGVLKVDEDWFALSAITLAFILSNIWRKEGSSAFISARKNSKVVSLTESDDVESGKIQGTLLEKDELAGRVGIAFGGKILNGDFFIDGEQSCYASGTDMGHKGLWSTVDEKDPQIAMLSIC